MICDTGASRSYVSQSFNKSFDNPLGDWDCLLRVSIANKHGVSALSIFRGCTLEIFGEAYLIDLFPIPMGNVCVIVAMDGFSIFVVIIGCEGL